MSYRVCVLGVETALGEDKLLAGLAHACETLVDIGDLPTPELYAALSAPDPERPLRWVTLLGPVDSKVVSRGFMEQVLTEALGHLVVVLHDDQHGSWLFARLGEGAPPVRLVSEGGQRAVLEGRVLVLHRDDENPVVIGLRQYYPAEPPLRYLDLLHDGPIFRLCAGGRALPRPEPVPAAQAGAVRRELPLALSRAIYDHEQPSMQGRSLPTRWDELLDQQTDEEIRLLEMRLSRYVEVLTKIKPPRMVATGMALPAAGIARLAVVRGPAACERYVGWYNKFLDLSLFDCVGEDGVTPTMVELQYFLDYRNVAICCGATLREGLMGLEAPWLKESAASAGEYEREMRTAFAFASAAARLPDEALAYAGGDAEPFEPGETFGFDHFGFARYLAAGLKAGAAAADVLPAFREFVAAFPRKVMVGPVGWTELMYAARAYYVHFEGRRVGDVAQALHELVLEAAGRRPESSAGPVAPPPRLQALASASWPELVAPIRERADALGDEIRALAGELERSPGLVITRLDEPAEAIARLGVAAFEIAGLGSAFNPVMVRAIDELRAAPGSQAGAALSSLAAFVAVTSCFGRGMPPPAVAMEQTWLEMLAAIRPELTPAQARLAGFAALGAGAVQRVPALLDGALPEPRPGEAFGLDARAAGRYLAAALARKLRAEDVEPAFAELVRGFPHQLASGTMTWTELLLAARAFFTGFRGRPLNTVFFELHHFVRDTFVEPPRPKAAPPPRPTGPPAPRRAEPPPLPRAVAAPGALGRLFGKKPALAWQRFDLFDVHGLFGGRTAAVFADGDLWFQEVQPGATAARLFRVTLPADALDALGRLLAEHDLRAMSFPRKNAIAGEATTVLTLATAGGVHSVSKLANDKHAGFEALTGWVVAIGARAAAAVPPAWAGPFDWHWRP